MRSPTIVIVDVLRFTTVVDVVVSRGATIEPRPWTPGVETQLSPSALVDLEPGTHLVVPSPNGAALSLKAAATGATVVAGCLRNATAVGEWCRGRDVEVWPAGERGRPDAEEDQLGAEAIRCAIEGRAFDATDLVDRLRACPSGQELIGWGLDVDVELAAAHDVSTTVPVLRDGVYR